MKKPLLIITIITTIIAVGCFLYSSVFFGVYIKSMAEGKKAAEAAGIIFFIIFNFFTMGASVINFIPNLIHFIKSKHLVVKILFFLAIALVVASVSMLLVLLIKNGAAQQKA